MKILDFGKHKGEALAECPKSYLRWLATHKMVLAKRNRWASSAAKELLERMAQAAALADYEARREAEMAVRIAEQLVRANQGVRGDLTSRAFSLMR